MDIDQNINEMNPNSNNSDRSPSNRENIRQRTNQILVDIGSDHPPTFSTTNNDESFESSTSSSYLLTSRSTASFLGGGGSGGSNNIDDATTEATHLSIPVTTPRRSNAQKQQRQQERVIGPSDSSGIYYGTVGSASTFSEHNNDNILNDNEDETESQRRQQEPIGKTVESVSSVEVDAEHVTTVTCSPPQPGPPPIVTTLSKKKKRNSPTRRPDSETNEDLVMSPSAELAAILDDDTTGQRCNKQQHVAEASRHRTDDRSATNHPGTQIQNDNDNVDQDDQDLDDVVIPYVTTSVSSIQESAGMGCCTAVSAAGAVIANQSHYEDDPPGIVLDPKPGYRLEEKLGYRLPENYDDDEEDESDAKVVDQNNNDNTYAKMEGQVQVEDVPTTTEHRSLPRDDTYDSMNRFLPTTYNQTTDFFEAIDLIPESMHPTVSIRSSRSKDDISIGVDDHSAVTFHNDESHLHNNNNVNYNNNDTNKYPSSSVSSCALTSVPSHDFCESIDMVPAESMDTNTVITTTSLKSATANQTDTATTTATSGFQGFEDNPLFPSSTTTRPTPDTAASTLDFNGININPLFQTTTIETTSTQPVFAPASVPLQVGPTTENPPIQQQSQQKQQYRHSFYQPTTNILTDEKKDDQQQIPTASHRNRGTLFGFVPENTKDIVTSSTLPVRRQQLPTILSGDYSVADTTAAPPTPSVVSAHPTSHNNFDENHPNGLLSMVCMTPLSVGPDGIALASFVSTSYSVEAPLTPPPTQRMVTVTSVASNTVPAPVDLGPSPTTPASTSVGGGGRLWQLAGEMVEREQQQEERNRGSHDGGSAGSRSGAAKIFTQTILFDKTRSRADVDAHITTPPTPPRPTRTDQQQMVALLSEKDEAEFLFNTGLFANKRVRVVQLLMIGLIGILFGWLGNFFVSSSCHYASIPVSVGQNGDVFALHFGLWNYSPVDSALNGFKYCYPYGGSHVGDAPIVSRSFNLVALLFGTYSLVILWFYLITGRAMSLLWRAAVIASILAGIFQLLTLQFFVGTMCRHKDCHPGPGAITSIITAVAWIILGAELYYNCPLSASSAVTREMAILCDENVMISFGTVTEGSVRTPPTHTDGEGIGSTIDSGSGHNHYRRDSSSLPPAPSSPFVSMSDLEMADIKGASQEFLDRFQNIKRRGYIPPELT